MPLRREDVAAALKYLQDKADLRGRFERATSLDPQEQDLADIAVETGASIIPLSAYIDDFKVQKDAKTYIKGLLQFAKGMRKELPDDPDLQAIHDEIVGLIAATLYKLERFE